MPFLMAAVYDRLMRRVEVAGMGGWRSELLAPIEGSVLEIGAGTGRNLTHYPPGLGRLVLTEPDRFMRAKLEKAVERSRRRYPVDVLDTAAERLPFSDNEFDAVVSTLVLCSVPDPRAVLAEVHRVLRPGGRFVFIEHVAADRPRLLGWQRRLEPIWKLLAGGCHLTRDTDRMITDAGFAMSSCESGVMRKALPIVKPTVRGTSLRR
jgi:ubiquinone/menaquinone biosynthesis C-methylase UbiE